MAKLSSRGRTELVRMVKEKTMPDIVPCDGCENGIRKDDLIVNDHTYYMKGDVCTSCEGKGFKKPLTCWERSTRALMSDGKVLEKLDVCFQDGRKHSYGWKVRGKAKEGITAESFENIYVKAGYTRELSRQVTRQWFK